MARLQDRCGEAVGILEASSSSKEIGARRLDTSHISERGLPSLIMCMGSR